MFGNSKHVFPVVVDISGTCRSLIQVFKHTNIYNSFDVCMREHLTVSLMSLFIKSNGAYRSLMFVQKIDRT